MNSKPAEIAAWIRSRKSEFTELLRKMVEMETPSTRPETMESIFTWFTDQFESIGYRSVRIPGKDTAGQLLSIPSERRKNTPNQLLIGHCDTVWPLHTLKSMPCELKNGQMSGPGIYDMKAGLLEILFALKTIDHMGLKPEVTPVVFITSDEEIGSFESRSNIMRLSNIADRCFVLEPALGIDGRIKTSRKGVGNYFITVHGKPAHSGLSPEQGRSAIVEMTYIIQMLYDLNDPEKGTTVNVGTIQGGERVNVIAAKSTIEVDVRIAKKEEARKIDEAIRNIVPRSDGVSITVEGGIDRMPMEKTKGTEILWDRAQALGSRIGIKLADGMSGGASDGNLTNMVTPTLDGLGAVGDGAHAEHEHILIDETLNRAVLLTLLILEPPLQIVNAPESR
ncbi:M20 family metallopeptidase [Rhodohalobacter mucosus]|uniref:Carboxypeptidase n=1 Tax=Rhodohalobacter mucosus TaxID=2079485 RepID=A0A316TPU9_9BACT|nr:M20 family metallopeptidase [Rhodohalobacter mucosus]PWN06420.1 carboxypeptidase [Rhodohalobacter mucosus]